MAKARVAAEQDPRSALACHLERPFRRHLLPPVPRLVVRQRSSVDESNGAAETSSTEGLHVKLLVYY